MRPPTSCTVALAIHGLMAFSEAASSTAGNYTGALRPQIHYTPPKGFMNDPNGLHRDAKGLWHLYYQYNPTDVVAGNQHWGHATSTDLYRWKNEEIAISPDAEGEAIFSGSAVIDANNTSGMFPNQTNGVVAIYTLNTPTKQTQQVAFSFDGGYTFAKYGGNPVLDVGSDQFRDPKVVWYGPTQTWVMVVAYAHDFTIGFFTSKNLLSWTLASNFTHQGLLGLQYECPNLVSMPMEGDPEPWWVLTVSINPGAPRGGSITQYFPGCFDGTTFTAVDGAARLADFGKDNYAGQFFFGGTADDGQSPVSLAWASNWQYSQAVPTGPLEGWRSSMSLPRVHYLTKTTRTGYDLVSRPYNLFPIIKDQLVSYSSAVPGHVNENYSTVASGAVYLKANFSGIPSAASALRGSANFTFSSSASGESVRGGILFGGDTHVFVDRANTRAFDNPFFADKFSTSVLFEPGRDWTLEVVIDRSIIEVFLDGGRQSATLSFFPTSPLDTVSFGTDGLSDGMLVQAAVWALKSGWTE